MHLNVTTILQFISYFISPLSMKTSASTISSSLTTIPPFMKMRSFWACNTTIKRRLAGEFHTHSCTCTKWNSSAKKTSCSQHGFTKLLVISCGLIKCSDFISLLLFFFFLFISFHTKAKKNWTWNNRERILCLHVVSYKYVYMFNTCMELQSKCTKLSGKKKSSE